MMRMRTAVAVLFGLLLVGSVWAGSLQESMAKGKELFQGGKFREACDWYKNLLVEHKDELKGDSTKAADAWEAFGEALQKAGWKERADEAFKRGRDHRSRTPSAKEPATGPTTPDAPPPTATMDKYRLTSVKNEKAQEFYRRGAAYLEEKRPLYAILEFEKALEIEPENIDLMDITGRTMADYGENYFDKALPLMTKVRQAKGDAALSLEQWLALGRAATLAKKYDFKVAEESLTKAVQLNAQSFLANYYLGDLESTRGEYKKAVEWFEKARKIEPGDLRALWGLGDAHTGLKEFVKALDYFAQAYEMNPDMAEAAFKYAVGLKNVDRIDESIHFHQTAISLDPAKARYHLGLVAIYLPRVMDFSAKKHLETALALEPENPWCHFYQGLFLEMRRRLEEAVEEYQTAAYYGPQMLDVRYQLANMFAGIGNSFPGNNFTCENAADRLCYNALKDNKRAYRLYKEILTINPKYQHAAKIQTELARIEEILETDQHLRQAIDQLVR